MATYAINAKMLSAGRIVGYSYAPTGRIAIERWLVRNPTVGYAGSDLVAKRKAPARTEGRRTNG